MLPVLGRLLRGVSIPVLCLLLNSRCLRPHGRSGRCKSAGFAAALKALEATLHRCVPDVKEIAVFVGELAHLDPVCKSLRGELDFVQQAC